MNTPLTPEAWLTFVGVLDLPITRALVADITNAVSAGVKRMHLLIQSPGGSVSEGVFLYNYFRAAPIEIVTYNCGHVGSAATIAYLGGSPRIATTTATFLIHRARASPQYSGDSDHMRASANSLKADDARMFEIISSNLSLTDEQTNAANVTDLILTSNEALAAGLANKVGVFHPNGLLRSV